jgi:hypothetical protein
LVIRALCCFALATTGFAQEPVAPDAWPVSVRWDVEPLRPYPGQPVDVVLRVELPPAFADEQLIPRFRQPLDVHLELSTPFADGAWDAVPLELESPATGPRLALDGERVRLLSRAAPGSRVLEHRTRWSFDAAGPRLLGPAIANGRWATSWSTDFLGQRTPNDALEGRAASRAFSFDVQALPGEGRPPSFTDAVGDFEATAAIDKSELQVGEVLTVTWTLSGTGDLERLTPPDLAGWEDFHLLGTREDFEAGARTLRADLRALDPRTRSLPSIAFAAFDPLVERYVDLSTEPLPLVVTGDRALPKPTVTDAEAEVAPESRANGPLARTLLASLALAGGLLLCLRWALGHPRVRHARALARFEAALARGAEPRDALARFAVERLDLGPFAPFDPRFEARLVERGADAETARRWSAWIRAELEADYGGPEESSEAPRELARQLHGELLAAGRS